MADKGVSTDSLAMESRSEYTGPKLKVAMIGCGGIAQLHLESFKSIPQVEIVAGVDINPDRLKVMEEKWGVTQLYTDWKKMLKEVQPDAVDICTPNGVHAAPAIDAASAGCHVIVEKPMAMNPAECKKMIDAAKKKKLAVGFQFRYHPKTEFITRARDAGEFGNIMFVRCQALRRRGIPNWGVFGRKELQGGGPMIDIGVHMIEMAHYAIGSPRPVAASGNTWTYLGDKASDVVSMWPNWDHETYTVEDLAVGQIRFENGAILQIESSFAAHIEKDVWDFTLLGDKGGANWESAKTFTDRAGTMINSSAAFLPDHGDFPSLFKIKLQNWVNAIMNDAPLQAPGEAGWMVQKMLDGIYRSAEAGKEVGIE
jgi:predicted dehydrogenase